MRELAGKNKADSDGLGRALRSKAMQYAVGANVGVAERRSEKELIFKIQ